MMGKIAHFIETLRYRYRYFNALPEAMFLAGWERKFAVAAGNHARKPSPRGQRRIDRLLRIMKNAAADPHSPYPTDGCMAQLHSAAGTMRAYGISSAEYASKYP